jgi:hypothetical protein
MAEYLNFYKKYPVSMLLRTLKCLHQNALQRLNEFARTKRIRTKQLSMATSAVDCEVSWK